MKRILVAALAALMISVVGASADTNATVKVESVKKVVEYNATTDADRMFATVKEKKVFSAEKNATKKKTMWQKFTGWLGAKKQEVKDANLTAKTKAAIEKAKQKAAAVTAKAKEVAKAASEKAKKIKDAAVEMGKKTKEGVVDAYKQYKEKKKKKEEEVKER